MTVKNITGLEYNRTGLTSKLFYFLCNLSFIISHFKLLICKMGITTLSTSQMSVGFKSNKQKHFSICQKRN